MTAQSVKNKKIQFNNYMKNKKPSRKINLAPCDFAGARTQDPILKRDMLYQLSYEVFIFLPNFAIRFFEIAVQK